MADTKKSDDIHVTKGMLDETRNELKSDISSLSYEMKAGFKKVDARFKGIDSRFNDVDSRFNDVDSRFNAVDARFNAVDARFNAVDARFDTIDAKFDDIRSDIQALTASIHRALALHEEQEARNKYVLDGHQNLHDRQDKFEHEIRQDVTNIKTVISKMNKTN